MNSGWCELDCVTTELKTFLLLCEHFRINLQIILELFHVAACLLGLFLAVLLHYSNFITAKRGETSTLLMSVSSCDLAAFESNCVTQQNLLTFLLPVWTIDGMLVDYWMVLFCLHKLCSVEKGKREIISIGRDVFWESGSHLPVHEFTHRAMLTKTSQCVLRQCFSTSGALSSIIPDRERFSWNLSF